jgi:endonuclease/exonuclease/phosphatase family metal-dependent hydrolase
MTVWGAALLALGACQVIAGVEDRELDPRLEGCTLPAGDGAKLRFVNAYPSDQRVDVCVRATGTASWGRPILREGGKACPNGFEYAQASAPFTVPVGRVDVKVVAAGSPCNAPALAEAGNIETRREDPTLVIHSGNAQERALFSFPEIATPPLEARSRFRFINAIAGSKPLIFGYGAQGRLPTTLETAFTPPLAYGQTAPEDFTPAVALREGKGYVSLGKFATPIAATDDAAGKKALLAATLAAANTNRNIIAVGELTGNAFPARGLVCDEFKIEGVYTACEQTKLSVLTVDTFNPAFFGANAPDERARRPVVADAVKNSTADFLCLLEVARDADKEEIAAAGRAGELKFSVVPKTDLDTKPTDARDRNGQVPPASTTPACGGSVKPADVQAFFKCVVDNCSTVPGDSKGILQGTPQCIPNSCTVPAIPLYSGNLEEQRCFSCALTQILSLATFDQARELCTTDPRDMFAFGGQAPSMFLSRLPIVNSEVYVLPSTNFRRVAIRSEVELERGKLIDVYCVHPSALLDDKQIPYAGNYANLAERERVDPYWQESNLQAQRLVDWVKQKSGDRPVIFTGDFSASAKPNPPDPGAPEMTEVNPEHYVPYQQAFKEPFPPNWFPKCNRCASNPYNNPNQNLWVIRTFTLNMGENPAVAAQMLYTGLEAVTLTNGNKGALSNSFGYRLELLRP